MAEKEFEERRRYIRFDNINISFKTKEIAKEVAPENIVQAVAINMSIEGICFTSNYKLKPGTIIELDVLVPFQPRPAHLEGEVRWCNPIKTEEGRDMFNTGVRISLSRTDEVNFLLYICDRMQEHIRGLEEKLKNADLR